MCTLWRLDVNWKNDEGFLYLWEKMSLATFRLRLLTFPEPVWERVAARTGPARRGGATLAARGQTAGAGRALAAAGRRRRAARAGRAAGASPPAPIGRALLFRLPRMPLATTESHFLPVCLPASGGEWPPSTCFSSRDPRRILSDRPHPQIPAYSHHVASLQGGETFAPSKVKCHVQRPSLEWHFFSRAVPYIDFQGLKRFPLHSHIMHIVVNPSDDLSMFTLNGHDAEQRGETVTHHPGSYHITVHVERI